MFERVCEVLEEFVEISKEEMTFESDLISDLGLNSIDVVEIVVAMEEEFEIEIPDRMISSFKTIADIVKYVEGK